MKKYLNPSMPAVTEDSALELMVHHLQLAHTFYQLTSSNREENRQEAERLLNEQYQRPEWVDDGGHGRSEFVSYSPDSPEIVSALAWIDTTDGVYERMKGDADSGDPTEK